MHFLAKLQEMAIPDLERLGMFQGFLDMGRLDKSRSGVSSSHAIQAVPAHHYPKEFRLFLESELAWV
jgi:hypothetical protein